MAEHSEKIFVALIQENTGIIHKVINLYVDAPEDRRDLKQEILLQAWKSYARFEGKSAFSTWLYRISLNTVLTFRRKATPEVLPLSRNDTTQTTQPANLENKDLLFHAIRQLGEVDRMIITLHLEGYRNPEIADITGLKINHLNVKLHRIKKQIVSQLKKDTYGLT
ncbi:MAG: sigma-70 family RNA polymerase sigma factor [Bacteroidota bacterium]